ncbi:hypothetical protein MA20_48515 [Bradyrhizobium japonicum]|uniref:Uncharacterized protein n=1 Tax=Bradyrhizobium japonicum TaxID=375 RepID=A0A0A3YGA5_BRAJP|nr:hypothetical protein MA20_48515 [Bradyrhizobium japonicum]
MTGKVISFWYFFSGVYFFALERSRENFAKPLSTVEMNFMLGIFSASGFASGEVVKVTFTLSFSGAKDQLLSAVGLMVFWLKM